MLTVSAEFGLTNDKNNFIVDVSLLLFKIKSRLLVTAERGLLIENLVWKQTFSFRHD